MSNRDLRGNSQSDQSKPTSPPTDKADLATESGARREPLSPDDVDADGQSLGNQRQAPHNPAADSPDDA